MAPTAPVDFVRRKAQVEPRLPIFDLIDRLKTYGDDTTDLACAFNQQIL